MQWNKSFLVKDAIVLLTRITRGKSPNLSLESFYGSLPESEYTTTFQPELLSRLTNVMLDCPERPLDFKFKVAAPEREYDYICLTSGGADSTIAWYWANKPQGLYIDIGQEYAPKEGDALRRLAIPYKYVDLRGTHLADKRWQHIIPGRNFLFLCVAAEMVKDNGSIWFAMVDGEGAESDKGDKSLMFVSLFQDWYYACTGRTINVQTMVDKTKVGWLKWFSEHYDINIIRKDTVTCFSGGTSERKVAALWEVEATPASHDQCGMCQACLRKYLAFMSNGMDIAEDFVVHPMFGAAGYVIKYKRVLNEALKAQDYSHYSHNRCVEDLVAIADAEKLMVAGRSV